MSDEKIETPEIVEPAQAPAPEQPAPTELRMQYVFVTLADGRRGAFAGPELISKAELLLKPPTLVDIVFSEPKGMEAQTPPVPEEVPNADPQKESPADVGEKA